MFSLHSFGHQKMSFENGVPSNSIYIMGEKNVQDDKLPIIQSKQMAAVKDKGPALSSSSECMLTAGVWSWLLNTDRYNVVRVRWSQKTTLCEIGGILFILEQY